MKKIFTTLALALTAMMSMAEEANDTTYVMMNFNQNPWNYPVTEVTEGWRPDFTDLESPGAILKETDFSWPVNEDAKVKVTLYPVDLDEYNKVAMFGHVEPGSEAITLGVETEMINVLYTQPGTTMRFEVPEGYKFGKMVFYCFHSANFLVGDDYEEEFEYEYNGSMFKQKLKVWTPTSPFKNQYDYAIWEGDDTNILFNYPYFTAHFVKIDIRLVPDGSAGIHATTQSPSSTTPCYDLQGRRVSEVANTQHSSPNTQHSSPNTQHSSPNTHLKKGIYIVNGRKIVK